VRFLGERDHDALPDALRAGDMFLLSSDLDAFPLVLLEALSCGLPAVATDPPGVRAMVHGSDAALLAPTGDAAALGARVAELAAATPEERARRGASARALVEQRYALPQVVDRLEEVYADALRTRARVLRPH
jgi:glycosyltransferase involved in cell wall biosynthesis